MKTYHKRNRAYFIGALVFVLISTLFAVVLQFFKGDVLDYAVAGEISSTIRSAILLVCFILCETLFYFFYKRFVAGYVVGCTKCLKHDIFDRILRKSYVDYKQHQQGEYISKYTNDADAIRSRRFELLPLFWEILFKVILVSAALFFLDQRIALLTLALLTTPLYVPKLIEKRLQRVQTEYLSALEQNLAKVSDWLSGFEIIKNFSVERNILTMFDRVNDSSMEKLLNDKRLGAVSQLITTLISYLSYFIVLACAAWLVLTGDFSAGDFFVAIGMIDQLSYPLISLAEVIRQLIGIRPTCTSMEAFVASPDNRESTTLEKVEHEIHFQNVTFAYDGQHPILNGFAFRIQKGNRYLFQGPSGCGKTTAVNLLLRYYDADSGSITIDGVPIGAYDSTYGCMTVVRQEAVLFRDTLRNNLTMYQAIPDETLLDMLCKLGLEKFAAKDALDTMIVENGANLSGGEKKRICLARALLRDTEVLLLDEPLANLDEATADRIEDLLLSITGKTMVVVSHQFTERKLDAFDQVLTLTRKPL